MKRIKKSCKYYNVSILWDVLVLRRAALEIQYKECVCALISEKFLFSPGTRDLVFNEVFPFLNHAYNFVIIICVIIYVGINLVNWLIRWKNFDCLYWWCFRGHKRLMFSMIVYHFNLLIFPILSYRYTYWY